MKRQIRTHTRNTDPAFAPPVQLTQLQSRPWGETVEKFNPDLETSELIEAEPGRAKFGHNLANIPFSAPDAPPAEPNTSVPNVQADFETSLNQAKTGGSPLDNAFREKVEPAMGADFSGVKVHTDAQADQLSQSIQAKAFTTGNDIFFKKGEYEPGSQQGQELLAHELTHVVQQQSDLAHGIQQNRVAQIQRAISSPRFTGNTTLEDISDGNGTLKNGDESEAVRKVQHAIHDHGILFRGNAIDGKFGRETERRVTSFQRRNGITSDPIGEVGSATITKLDELFPQMALPTTAGDLYTFAGMLDILRPWNSAMIRDLRNLRVEMVAGLQWDDEEFDGTSWVVNPMLGAGETSGTSIIIATNDTNENVAKSLYHEYQHARSPRTYSTRDWADEESRVYRMETDWAIARGITPDPNLTTTNPVTGEVEADTAGITSQVETYPGLDTANPGEVIGKVGTNRVRVRMPNGRVTVRSAVAGDSVPGPRRITPPRHLVRDKEWL